MLCKEWIDLLLESSGEFKLVSLAEVLHES